MHSARPRRGRRSASHVVSPRPCCRAAEEGGHSLPYVEPVIRELDVVAERRSRAHASASTSTGWRSWCCCSSASSPCSCRSTRPSTSKGDRRYTHFFAALTLFSAGMLVMVPAQHGAVDPRLGDHGPVLVPADRALVGGTGQQRGRAQGVLHRPRRRRRAARRHGDPVLRRHRWARLAINGFNIQAISGWAISSDASQTVLMWGCGRAVHRVHRQVGPVPAAHLAARRHGRPDAGVVAVALARPWSSPASSSSPACTRCSSPGSTSSTAAFNLIAVDRCHHASSSRRPWRSCRTTSRRCWRTRRCRSSAT